MNKNLSVFVADPVFDHKGVSTVIPLGAGLVGAYLKKKIPDISVEIFKGATPLLKAIEKKPPDILGLSSYVWNKNLAIAIAEYAKEINPNVLIIFGGPEIDINQYDLEFFVKKYACADLFVHHEGELALAKIVQKYIELNCNKKQLLNNISELGNCFFIDSSKNLLSSPKLPRIEDLDDIPSPYLTGIFDKFLSDPSYMPMIQTNRGCPYSCTFCQEGESYFTKVKRHSLNYVTNELNYIAERAPVSSGLWITDSNWAMYKWDEDIAKHIASLQKEKGWPSEIISSTGKANLDRIIKITKILNNTMYISNSVQSMDNDVLKDIKRKNLNPTELEKNKESLRGIRQEPEIIVPLPNETKTTFFNGINKLFDSGPKQRFAVFQTLILTNTEMAHGTSIEKFGLKIKHKQHFGLMGRINGKFVCETERVVAATNTLSTEDYLECRAYAMLLDAILRFEPIQEIFDLLDANSVNYSTFSMALYNSVNSAPEKIKFVIEKFKNELLDEMHDNETEVIKYMEKNEENYKAGLKGGGNLKHSNMLWIDCFDLTFEWLFKILRSVLKHKTDMSAQVDNIEKYLRFIYHDRFFSEAPQKVSATFDYDIIDWLKKDTFTPLNKFTKKVSYNFLKTPVSDLDGTTIWQDFGFKLNKKQKTKKIEKPTGYQNKLFISKLRRKVEKNI